MSECHTVTIKIQLKLLQVLVESCWRGVWPLLWISKWLIVISSCCVFKEMEHHIESLIFFVSTDIPNVLVGTSFNIDDVNGGFVVHWLNNKEFHFTSSTEIFMHQLRKLSEKQLDHESDDTAREDEECSQEERERGLHMRLDHGWCCLFMFFFPH